MASKAVSTPTPPEITQVPETVDPTIVSKENKNQYACIEASKYFFC